MELRACTKEIMLVKTLCVRVCVCVSVYVSVCAHAMHTKSLIFPTDMFGLLSSSVG